MPDEKPIDGELAATGEAKATDSAVQTTDSGESTGAKETERTDWKGLYLTAKGKVERVNDLERENAELRQRAVAPPTGYAADPQYQAQIAYQQRIQQLQSIADRDPAAAAILDQMQIQDANQRRLQTEIDLSRISDEAEREGTIKYLQTGDYRNAAAARKAWRGDQLETREKERQSSAARDAEVEAAKKARAASPDTATRTVAAPKSSDGSIPFSQWQKDLDDARARNDFAEMRKLRSSAVQSRLTQG